MSILLRYMSLGFQQRQKLTDVTWSFEGTKRRYTEKSNI